MGEPIEKWTPRRMAKHVAVVPQVTHVAFPFRALEVVLMGRAPHLSGLALEGSEDIKIARSAMELTGTWELRNRSMQEVSGGEAQRIIVARALAQRPRILLLDEPTVHLDIKHQIAVMELLGRLNRDEGLTVLIVSHDLNMIARYARRVVLLKNGAVHADGSPGEVLTADNISDVYEARVEVFDLHGRPGIFPDTNGGTA
jgi:iron complex transport system ATP-binding protein